jgi:putative colanic acid biosynthesis acetyltransferase WcaF
LIFEMAQRLTVRKLSTRNKILRVFWRMIWITLFRTSPRMLHGWRRFLLRLFGAKIGRRTYVYSTVKIWAPWNLEMADGSCLSHYVDCYCVDKIQLGRNATVSQYSHLCTASHDYNQASLPLTTAAIRIDDNAWVTADVFIGPGVTIGVGAVVGARATVIRDVEPWTVVAGNPARPIGKRNPLPFCDASI